MSKGWSAAVLCALGGIMICAPSSGQGDIVHVRNAAGFRQAVAAAKPGTHILLEPGEYTGGLYFANVHGAPGKNIVIGATTPSNPPRLVGGVNAIHFSDASHLEVRDLHLMRTEGNGLNMDDGGTYDTPSHHITLRNLRISDLPKGNLDGIKLSGVDDFRVENCVVERWGGSGIDMVGCHRGEITGCTFQEGGDNGVQCKGGSSNINVVACRFKDPGGRGVNVGGSTGIPFFRPPVDKMPPDRRYEAKDIRVEGCTFVGSDGPVTFVGVDGAHVRFNTIYHPKRWAIRILQETRSPDFLSCRNGVFEDNLVVFRSDNWSASGVNIGSGTSPETFRFARNFWYCSDRPGNSRPTLPTPETDGIIGRDPLLNNPETGDFKVRPGSPALKQGAHAAPGRSSGSRP